MDTCVITFLSLCHNSCNYDEKMVANPVNIKSISSVSQSITATVAASQFHNKPNIFYIWTGGTAWCLPVSVSSARVTYALAKRGLPAWSDIPLWTLWGNALVPFYKMDPVAFVMLCVILPCHRHSYSCKQWVHAWNIYGNIVKCFRN